MPTRGSPADPHLPGFPLSWAAQLRHCSKADVRGCAYASLMARVMAVSFERYGRLYYLDPGEHDYRVGDRVLVPTESGPEVAECVWAPEWVDDDGLRRPAGLRRPGQRRRTWPATPRNRRRRAEAKLVGQEADQEHDLPMKVVGGRLPRLRRRLRRAGRDLLHRPAPGRLPHAWSASWPAACGPGSTCARSAPGTRPGCSAASATAAATCAARRS